MKALNRRFLVNFCVVFLFLAQLGVNLLSFYEINKLVQTYNKAFQTHEILYSINDLWLNEIEVENEIHDYVVSKDSKYLKNYTTLKELIGKKIEHLTYQVKDNQQQLNNIKLLTPLFANQMNYFDQYINKDSSPLPAPQILNMIESKSYSPEISDIIDNMHNNEQMLLKKRQQRSIDNTNSFYVYLKIMSLMNIILVILFLIIFNQQYTKAIVINRQRREAENQLKGIVQGTTDSIAAINTQYQLIVFNKAFEQEYLIRYGKPVLLGENIKEYIQVLPDEDSILLAFWDNALKGQEFKVIHKYKNEVNSQSYEITFSPVRDRHQTIIGAAAISRDITDYLLMEEKMKTANAELAQSINKIRLQNASISALNLLGSTLQSCLTVDETLGPIATYASKILPNTSGILYMAHSSGNYLDLCVTWGDPQIRKENIASDHCWALRRGQTHIFFDKEKSVCCDHIKKANNPPPSVCIALQAQNDVVGLIYIEFILETGTSESDFNQIVKEYELLINSFGEAIALSISNIKLRESLHRRSIRDPLTNMFNRTYLDESFEREIKRAIRQHTNLAVVMMDIDHFKSINDNFGHEAGDTVLVKISEIISNHLRHSDIVCRYGGEEILLLLFEIHTGEEVVMRINDLRQIISKTLFKYHRQTFSVTASFGIACLNDFLSSPESLISEADKALYSSKNNGRNKVTIAQTTKKDASSNTF